MATIISGLVVFKRSKKLSLYISVSSQSSICNERWALCYTKKDSHVNIKKNQKIEVMPFLLAFVVSVWVGSLAAELKTDHEIFKRNIANIERASSTNQLVDKKIKENLMSCYQNFMANFTQCVKNLSEKPPRGVSLLEIKEFMHRTGNPLHFYTLKYS